MLINFSEILILKLKNTKFRYEAREKFMAECKAKVSEDI